MRTAVVVSHRTFEVRNHANTRATITASAKVPMHQLEFLFFLPLALHNLVAELYSP